MSTGVSLSLTATTGPQYVTPVIAACNGFVYIGQPIGDTIGEAGNQGSAPLVSNLPVSMCFLNLTIFMVDGTHIVTLPLATGNVTPYTNSQSATLVSTGSTSPFLATATVDNTDIYTSGQTILISGADQTAYNGEFEITVTSPTTFTYEIIAVSAPTTPATGTITVGNILGTAPTNCSLCCNWRGRLVLAGDSGNPQNFYMARVGTPTDWDYSQTDPAAAVAGNLSTSGQIGAAIIALIPYTDDYMLIQTADSMWMLEGDPADGGTIVRVAQNMGGIGPNAWTQDASAILYFIAQGGMYQLRPVWEMFQPPQLMTGGNYDQYFQGLNYSDQISMVFDPDKHYIYFFDTPGDGTTAGTHLVHDMRNGGLWPQQFPANIGPTVTLAYNPTGSGVDRVIVLGGQDGYLRKLDPSALDDDGTAIDASIVLGPFHPTPEASLLGAVTIDMGEVPSALAGSAPVQVTGETPSGTIDGSNATFTLAETPIEDTQEIFLDGTRLDSVDDYVLTANSLELNDAPAAGSTLLANYQYLGDPANPWNAVASMFAGPDAYSVTEGLAHNQAVISMTLERRQKTMRQRMRGGWFSLMIANDQLDTFFSFESATLEFMPAGRNRERR
jgi:hypothetical protein